MDTKSFAQIIMNPVRQRIIQYLLIHEKGTPAEIQAELSDVPTASLYRHIKKLYDGNCITVVEEKRVRGTIEKTYAMVQNPFNEEPTMQDLSAMFYTFLLSLQTSFLQYFEKEGADPKRDMLTLSTSTLMLSEEEFMAFMQKLGEVFETVIHNGPTEGRKSRRITFISSPGEEN